MMSKKKIYESLSIVLNGNDTNMQLNLLNTTPDIIKINAIQYYENANDGTNTIFYWDKLNAPIQFYESSNSNNALYINYKINNNKRNLLGSQNINILSNDVQGGALGKLYLYMTFITYE